MIVTYALPVVDEAIPSAYRKVKINLEFKMGKDDMMKAMNSFHKNDT